MPALRFGREPRPPAGWIAAATAIAATAIAATAIAATAIAAAAAAAPAFGSIPRHFTVLSCVAAY
jgi:hypothetical protein